MSDYMTCIGYAETTHLRPARAVKENSRYPGHHSDEAGGNVRGKLSISSFGGDGPARDERATWAQNKLVSRGAVWATSKKDSFAHGLGSHVKNACPVFKGNI